MSEPPSLAGAPWLATGPVARVLAALDGAGEAARVVGGAVRNALVGMPPGDVDVATTATPEVVTKRAAAAGIKAVPTGIDHGTVTLVVDGTGVEVTTLRHDIETDGRRARVRFGRDWGEDARRRDFTINALSADRDGNVFDPVGGYPDLLARRVRFIGDPVTRIREDYLRILRFFRFHAGYGADAPDADGLRACMGERGGLARLSRERVRLEILKLLVAPRAPPTLVAMEEAGLIQLALGGVVHHGAFARLAGLEAMLGLPADAVRRLAALAVRLPEDAERLRERLRLAKVEHRRLLAAADGWRGLDPADTAAAKAALYRRGPADDRDVALVAWAIAGAAPDDAAWRARTALGGHWTPPRFPLKAADFAARGIAPGPMLGRALALAEADWLARGLPVEAAALADIAAAAAAGARRLASEAATS